MRFLPIVTRTHSSSLPTGTFRIPQPVSLSFQARKSFLFRSLHSSSILFFPPSLTIRHFAPQTKSFKIPRCNVAPPTTPPPQRIAVVGGGLAGLSVIYHLLNSTSRYARKRNFDQSSIHITLFDPAVPGTAGASAAAAGLLHEFRPRPKKKIWNHQKGIDAALHLLSVAEAHSQKLVSTPGILKLGFDDRTIEDFRIAARRYPKEVEYLEAKDIAQRFPGIQTDVPGLFIQKGHVVDTLSYMKSLWKICEASGRVTWSQRSISSVFELFEDQNDQPYDTVVLCAGSAVKDFIDLKDVPITRCLGHNVVMEGEQVAPSVPLMSGMYIVPQGKPNNQVIAGATHLYGFGSSDVNVTSYPNKLKKLKEVLSSRLDKLDPNLFEKWSISAVQAGIRAIPPRTPEGAIPIVCQVKKSPKDRSCWLFTGLGGRGLLYHAFLGRRLAHAIVAGCEHHIPGEARKQTVSLK